MATLRRTLAAFAGFLALLAVTAPRLPAAPATYAGTIVSVDRQAGTVVVGDVGPAGAAGEPRVTPRTIAITPTTAFVRVARATAVPPTGWPGNYVETALTPWALKPGDYVTVEAEPSGGRPVARKVTVVDTGRP
jgi:hypothetical protein